LTGSDRPKIETALTRLRGHFVPEAIDLVSALEHKNAHLKQMVDEYNMNRQIARNMMSLPGVNKDIQHRLNNVATGAIDRQMLLEQRKDEDEGEAGAAAKKK